MTDAEQGTSLSLTDLNITFSQEPRILDERLGEMLGFARPRAIRQIIERNQLELETYGSLATRRGESRGQEFTEHWLTEGQALVICALSRTDKAAQVRKALIDVFMAWRRVELYSPDPAPDLPDPAAMSLSKRINIACYAATTVARGDNARYDAVLERVFSLLSTIQSGPPSRRIGSRS